MMLERELSLLIAEGEVLQLSLSGLFRAEMALSLAAPHWRVGLLAATDRQLLLLSGSRRHLRLERAPYDRLTAVEWVPGLLWGKLEVTLGPSRMVAYIPRGQPGQKLGWILRREMRPLA
jgi:hypothetical protein